MQHELALKQLEVEKLKLEHGQHAAPAHSFDVTKHIRLVPPFQEKEVDKYFLHFEKVAESLKWPRENWTMLLQSVLTGKAREIYTELSVEAAAEYDQVKRLILKGYELVPEACRQRFRKWGKSAKISPALFM